MKTPPRDPCKRTRRTSVVHLGAFKSQLVATVVLYIYIHKVRSRFKFMGFSSQRTTDMIHSCLVCVCVNHLERCKTSNLAGGRWGTLQSAANEDAAMFLWKRTCNFPVFRQWQPAKPRTGMSFFQQFSNYCTVFAIWLSCIRTSKSFEQGRRKISSHSFSLPIIKPFLSGLTEVFLHVRCIPHQ